MAQFLIRQPAAKHSRCGRRQALVLLAALCIGAAPATTNAAKNVVLVVVNDQGMAAGCYQDSYARTPALDALAADGTRFTQAFASAASSSASCAAILTGLEPHESGQLGDHRSFQTKRFVRSLPVLLSRAGYRTCCIGRLPVEPEAVYRFDEYPNQQAAGNRSLVQMASNAELFIRQPDDRPFLIYYSPADPGRGNGSFGNQRKYPGVRDVTCDPDEVPVPDFLPDLPAVRSELAQFYQAVARTDQGLARLVRALKATDHWDDTLVIYVSDNGMSFPGGISNLYESGLRVPLVIRSPAAVRHGVVCDALVGGTDLLPTILEWTGARGPNYPLAGRSLLAILATAHPSGWDEVCAAHSFDEVTMYYPSRTIRTRDFQLIVNLEPSLAFPLSSEMHGSLSWQAILTGGHETLGHRRVFDYLHRPRFELYDVKDDPHQSTNLAARPEFAAQLKRLALRLQAWQQQTSDPWLEKERLRAAQSPPAQ